MADPAGWADWLKKTGERRCWLVELTAFSLAMSGADDGTLGESALGSLAMGELEEGEEQAGVVTLYYASEGFYSASTDVPPDFPYDPRIEEVRVEQSIMGSRFIGLTKTFAEVLLSNSDGGLDGLLSDYVLDGRWCTILLGPPSAPRSEYGVVFTGVVSKLFADRARIRLSLSDGIARLERRFPSALFGGTGGADGGADLKGKTLPKVFGKVLNVSPPLADGATLVYRGADAPIADVVKVYDRGIELVEVAGTPAMSQYQQTLDPASFKLGGTPAGTVTADFTGSTEYGAGRSKHGQIINDLLLEVGLVSSEIDAASFTAFNAAVLGEAGVWIEHDSDRTAAQAVEELLLSAGSFGGFNRYGKFVIDRLPSFTGTPVASFSDLDILGFDREPLPADVDPVIYRVEVAYQRNWTVQADLASAVSAARRSFCAEPERLAVSENIALVSQNTLSRVLYIPGLWNAEADALAEAVRQLSIWGTSPPRSVFRVSLPYAALPYELGALVTLSYPRFKLDAGKPAIIVGRSVDSNSGTVEFKLLV